MWSVFDYSTNRTITIWHNSIHNLAMSPDDNKIIVVKTAYIEEADVHYEGIIECYELETGKLLWEYNLKNSKSWKHNELYHLESIFKVNYVFDKDGTYLYIQIPGEIDEVSGLYKVSMETFHTEQLLHAGKIWGPIFLIE